MTNAKEIKVTAVAEISNGPDWSAHLATYKPWGDRAQWCVVVHGYPAPGAVTLVKTFGAQESRGRKFLASWGLTARTISQTYTVVTNR